MILFLIDYLKDTSLKLPAAFGYTSTRMILAMITSLAISILFGDWFIKKLKEFKIGQKIRDEEYGLIGKLHEKKADTPTMGGVLILFAMLLSMFLWMDLKHIFTLLLFLTTVILGLAGGIDDYLKLKKNHVKGLTPRRKLLCQGVVAALVASYIFFSPCQNGIECGSWFSKPKIIQPISAAGIIPGGEKAHIDHELDLKEYGSLIYFPFIKEPVLFLGGLAGALFMTLLIFFVVAGCSNAVNLTDGLDGLAAGCLIMVAGCLGAVAFLSNHREISQYLNILYIEGSGEIAIYLCAFAGACLGFLWFNSYPAQVFMGDIGSLTLGGILGVSAVLLKREFLLFIVGGIFVAEALSVILQVGSYRFRNKKRIFLCAPLHHHFEYKGWPETKVVMRFWILALLLAMIGMVSLKLQ